MFNLLFSICAIFSFTVLSLVGYFSGNLSERYSITSGSKLEFKNENCISVSYGHTAKSNAAETTEGITNQNAKIMLFGVFPIKDVSIQTVGESYVYVLGRPFGVKLYTEGVLVVGINEVETKGGRKTPAKDAGLKIGDSIITVDGKKIKNNEQLSEIFSKSEGKSVILNITRNGQELSLSITPVFSSETSSYKAGIWVRDSSAGIGTLTFYSPSSKIVGGLGHGICDTDTEKLMNLSSGELVGAEIISCNRSEVGCPGELVGKFTSQSIAKLKLNSHAGVFGTSDIFTTDNSMLMQVSSKQEVKNGYAQILSTVDSTEPVLYDCNIKIKSTSDNEQTQNIIVTVTDKQLISKTGGIVQGMSGSPIIQNGKLVGAVTHVLVDDPTKGYGIFAENMLETSESIYSEKFNVAS